MFVNLPDDYDKIYLSLSRRGARVLALGWRDLGTLSHSSIRELKRENVEGELQFAGFVIISCPLKPDSRSVIKVSFSYFFSPNSTVSIRIIPSGIRIKYNSPS